ncbi:MAG TPA: hypothetical protein VEV86_05840, partial [Vicinamibacterales bacterium]|nr:hypothetical protein [Vicinamibacterales bacterium]
SAVPFLRVIRDKRGYETTYLMHLYREGHRQRSRILYVFRSPGGVRVGRGALDPDVLREIEAQYPDIAFDWKDVREHQQHIEISPEPRRRKPPKREEAVAAAAPDVQAPAPAPALPAPSTSAPSPGAVPSAIEGATPDDQIAFLGRWYALIRERIPRRTSDPVRQEALMALTERLNPAAWTDADQIAAGLQQAAEALERLSHVFSRRRRRTRRRSNDSPASPGPTQSDS